MDINSVLQGNMQVAAAVLSILEQQRSEATAATAAAGADATTGSGASAEAEVAEVVAAETAE